MACNLSKARPIRIWKSFSWMMVQPIIHLKCAMRLQRKIPESVFFIRKRADWEAHGMWASTRGKGVPAFFNVAIVQHSWYCHYLVLLDSVYLLWNEYKGISENKLTLGKLHEKPKCDRMTEKAWGYSFGSKTIWTQRRTVGAEQGYDPPCQNRQTANIKAHPQSEGAKKGP